jgi:hypothetical protein
MFSEEGSLDPFLSVLQTAYSEPMSETRKIISEACGFPTVESFGAAVSSSLEKTLSGAKSTVSMAEDPYNSKYYNSDQRKILSKFFGLPDTLTQRATAPPTVSVLQMTLEKFESDPESKIISNKKNPWVWFLHVFLLLILYSRSGRLLT